MPVRRHGHSQLGGSPSHTLVENDATSAEFDGDVSAVNVGLDYWFTDKLLGGVSVGYARTDVDTTFNNGTFEEDTITFAPYGLFVFNEYLNFSTLVGYSTGSVDQDRLNGTVRSSTDVDTWFTNALLTGTKTFDTFSLVARVGYLWANRDDDGFVESGAANNVVAATATSINRVRGDLQFNYSSLWDPPS